MCADIFLSLCKPSSKRFTGEPFRPSRAVTIDLFPHTDHCELMVEFVRGEYLADLNEAEASAAEQAIAKKIEQNSAPGADETPEAVSETQAGDETKQDNDGALEKDVLEKGDEVEKDEAVEA